MSAGLPLPARVALATVRVCFVASMVALNVGLVAAYHVDEVMQKHRKKLKS